MTSLPTFEPYVLTHLDHHVPPVHLAAFFTFHLDEPSKGIPVLEAGVARLIDLLPFLTGNIASSNRVPGKQNVLEVQPPTERFLLQHPMFRTVDHDQSISPKSGNPIVSYDDLANEEFIPIPFKFMGVDPSPVFRFQVNLMLDGIILCLHFHHQALDGIGVLGVAKALAACCRVPNASLDDIETSLESQNAARRTISEAASLSNITRKPEEDYPPVACETTPIITTEAFLSRKFVLDAERIKYLQKECAIILQNQSDITDPRISGNVIVTAVLWLCTIRARFGQLTTNDELIGASSSALMFTEIRSTLQPPLPMSYMGNALVFALSDAPVKPIVFSSAPHSKGDLRTTAYIDPNDIHLLAGLARYLRAALQSVTNEYVRELISNRAAAVDWTPTARPVDINISSLRFFNFYDLDFGPSLGPVKDFDLPENRVPGIVWVMPARGQPQSSPWELRLTQQAELMEKVQNDRLILWLSPRTTAKL
jgi:hypothetical protein